MSRTLTAVLVAYLSASTVACTGGGTPPIGDTPQPVCASGGTVTVSGVTLTVPAGALSACTDIEMTVGGEVPTGYAGYSKLVRIEPASLALTTPATLSVPFTGNSTLARVFWSRPATTGYERLATTVSAGVATAQLSALGSGFVAGGVTYVDSPDASCVKTRLIEGRTLSPSTVAMLFTVDDCQGRPVTGLGCDAATCDFAVKENGADLGSEGALTMLQRDGLEVFVSLVLDMSSSTGGMLSQVVAGAKAFVRQLRVTQGLPVPVSIQLFAGEATLYEWQKPTLDMAKLYSRLDALSEFQATDPSSTDLYGSVITALSRQAGYESTFRARNYGGAFTAGYLVVFTDGRDTAGRSTEQEARDAVLASSEEVLGIALRTADYDEAALEAIAPSGVVTASSADSLPTEFEALAASHISGQIARTYLVGYCSPARSGSTTAAIEVEGAENVEPPASYTFSASSFVPGCSLSTFEHLCDGLECGGLGCGACDDRLASCDSATGQCVSYCLLLEECDGYDFTNPLGYTQVCPPVVDWMDCGAVCVDSTTDELNCGACGNACPTGATCTDGSCFCPTGQTACGSSCVDTATDEVNCGACGNVCPEGASCTSGACTCPVGRSACDGVCLDLSSSTENCGACGNECLPGEICDGGACACPSGADVCGGTCTGLWTASDCSACGVSCASDQVCAAGLCTSSCGSAAQFDGTLAARTYSPTSVALGDFNADGKPDLAVASSGRGSVSVLLGDGDGTFQRTNVDYAAGSEPSSVGVGDFDADGKLDVAVANRWSHTVSVLLGSGDGTLQPKVDYATGTNPSSVAVGDFDADGMLDLVTANDVLSSSTVSVLLGNGDGTFRSKMDYDAGLYASSVAVGDFDADGNRDLAIASRYWHTVSVFLGNGDGTFRAGVDYPAGDSPLSVTVGDFDADGRSDLAVASSGSSSVSVLLGNGDGTFQTEENYATGTSPESVTAGDFDADGKLDLAVANSGASTVSVLLGNGDGTFQEDAEYATGSDPRSVVVADFGVDGTLDIAVASYDSNTVSVLLGKGNGTFLEGAHYATESGPRSVVVGDINVDGAVDLAVANYDSSTISMLLGNGNGTFQPAVHFDTGRAPSSVAIGDFNVDGKPDLAATLEYANSVSVRLGNGNGTFQAKEEYETGRSPRSTAVGDFNMDGQADLAVANYYSGTVSVLLGNGDGTFRAKVDFATDTGSVSVAVGDFNTDGKPDLAVANAYSYNSNTVSVLLGDGAASFQKRSEFAAGTYPHAVAVGDFNADGKPDLVVQGSWELRVHLGRGDGTFDAGLWCGTGAVAESVGVGDFNADGKLDIAALGNSWLTVFLGNGDGTFPTSVDYATGTEPRSVAVADFNADGKPDVAVANSRSDTVSVLLGECLAP